MPRPCNTDLTDHLTTCILSFRDEETDAVREKHSFFFFHILLGYRTWDKTQVQDWLRFIFTETHTNIENIIHTRPFLPSRIPPPPHFICQWRCIFFYKSMEIILSLFLSIFFANTKWEFIKVYQNINHSNMTMACGRLIFVNFIVPSKMLCINYLLRNTKQMKIYTIWVNNFCCI